MAFPREDTAFPGVARQSTGIAQANLKCGDKGPMLQGLKNSCGQNYESGGQEFESLRARHVSLLFPERMLSWPSRLTHHNVGAIFYTVVPSGPL
jgi:hypothetical protein